MSDEIEAAVERIVRNSVSRSDEQKRVIAYQELLAARAAGAAATAQRARDILDYHAGLYLPSDVRDFLRSLAEGETK